ncbi:unnamed protein product [Owenia fusiformis]|uniref:G-protein coupled receptors family 1 profile domain-containing protein n=1 Tax=Owenia fusiformis TaxID=6347 RepID=A0A8S4PNS1_OWEFU|nr:unnamed protein product [Owenia fusiformis]
MFVVVSTYCIPLSVLTFTYWRIASTLWSRIPPGNRDEIRDETQLRSKKRIVKMLVTIVLVFGICWFPLNLFNASVDLFPKLLNQITTAEAERAYLAIFFSCHWLAMSNSFANPIIYGFLNESFRNDMRDILRRCPCIKRNGHNAFVSRTNSTRAWTFQNGSVRSSMRSLRGSRSSTSEKSRSQRASYRAPVTTLLNGATHMPLDRKSTSYSIDDDNDMLCSNLQTLERGDQVGISAV